MAEGSEYTLYYSNVSYYSHKVLMALFEKDVAFDSVFVDLMAEENHQDWYYQLNPSGMVPLLKAGKRFIPESDDIIDYIDNQHPALVPSPETDLGKDVAWWRHRLTSQIPIEDITFGVYYNPEISTTGSKISIPKEALTGLAARAEAKTKEQASSNPELKEIYNRKLQAIEERNQVMLSKDLLQSKIDSVQDAFELVDERLQKLTKSGADTWLCGPQYTVADITLTVLINRLVLLGLETVYFNADKRPLIGRYWERAQTRPSFVKMKGFGPKPRPGQDEKANK